MIRLLLTPVILFTLYRIALDATYIFVLSPIYGYMGFTFSFHLLRWAGVFMISVLTYYVSTITADKLSALFFELLLWILYAPFACFYSLSGRDTTFFYYMTLCFCGMHLILVAPWGCWLAKITDRLSSLINIVPAHRKALSKIAFWCVAGICILWTLASLYCVWVYADLSNWAAAFNVLRVYEIRAAQNLPSWTAYLFSTQTKVINTFILCMLCHKKKYWAMILPILLQIMFYFVLANKSDLFAIVLVLFIFVIAQWRRTTACIGVALTAGTLAATIFVFLSKYGLIPYSLYRRTFFAQPLISANYFDFFSVHVPLHFSEGRMGRLLGLTYPYPLSTPKLLMGNYSGSLSGNANGSFLASGFADMGFVGMLIYCLVLCVLLLVVSQATKKLPLWFAGSVLAIYVITLQNTNLFTALGTHGMLLAIFLLMLYGFHAWLDGSKEDIYE